MAAGSSPPRLRRLLLGAGAAALIGTVGGLAAHADGGVTLDPDRGVPGTEYTVTVACGESPVIYRTGTQDGQVQMTQVPYLPPELSEISPSTWRVRATAITTDDAWFVRCDDVELGTSRFDAESPHLWLGPRPSPFEGPLIGRTHLEGTDCPDGTEASVSIESDTAGDVATSVTIDRYGDWRVRLPAPYGDAEMRIAASCGSVTYPGTLLTTTSTEPMATPTPGSPSSVPPAAVPATPVSHTATYTG